MFNSKLIYGLGLIVLALAVFFIATRMSDKFSFGGTWHSEGNAAAADSISIVGVNKLDVTGNCSVQMILSEEEYVVYYFDPEEMKNLSHIKDSSLYLEFESAHKSLFRLNQSKSVQVKVYTKSINSITQEGVGSIDGTGVFVNEHFSLRNDGVGSMDFSVQTQSLDILNEGVGSIDIKGAALTAQIKNYGTGSIEAQDMKLKTAIVRNEGIGSINVFASDSLDMTNEGVGSINYSGNAYIVQMRSEGIGSINKN